MRQGQVSDMEKELYRSLDRKVALTQRGVRWKVTAPGWEQLGKHRTNSILEMKGLEQDVRNVQCVSRRARVIDPLQQGGLFMGPEHSSLSLWCVSMCVGVGDKGRGYVWTRKTSSSNHTGWAVESILTWGQEPHPAQQNLLPYISAADSYGKVTPLPSLQSCSPSTLWDARLLEEPLLAALG